MVSLWYDVSLHIAATNAFVPIRDLHAHLARPGHIGISLLEDKRLPSELQPYLQSMPLELLKPLVLAAGFPMREASQKFWPGFVLHGLPRAQ